MEVNASHANLVTIRLLNSSSGQGELLGTLDDTSQSPQASEEDVEWLTCLCSSRPSLWVPWCWCCPPCPRPRAQCSCRPWLRRLGWFHGRTRGWCTPCAHGPHLPSGTAWYSSALHTRLMPLNWAAGRRHQTQWWSLAAVPDPVEQENLVTINSSNCIPLNCLDDNLSFVFAKIFILAKAWPYNQTHKLHHPPMKHLGQKVWAILLDRSMYLWALSVLSQWCLALKEEESLL